MILSTARKGNTAAETLDDAVEPERVAFKRPFDGAYGIVGRGRSVKIVPDDDCVRRCRSEATGRGAWKLTCRKEFEDANGRLRIENALKRVDARWHYV